ncbi:hypothetical protein FB451DRAFT_1560777 [Mycena latifolia]|nr:hypothetical protein FB451DRAFT_1560777 [Mycena latifolia]
MWRCSHHRSETRTLPATDNAKGTPSTPELDILIRPPRSAAAPAQVATSQYAQYSARTLTTRWRDALRRRGRNRERRCGTDIAPLKQSKRSSLATELPSTQASSGGGVCCYDDQAPQTVAHLLRAGAAHAGAPVPALPSSLAYGSIVAPCCRAACPRAVATRLPLPRARTSPSPPSAHGRVSHVAAAPTPHRQRPSAAACG